MPQDYFTFLLRLLANYSCLCYYSELNSTPSPHIHLESQNVTLFGNKVFADKIGYGFQEELTLNLAWTLNPMTGVLIRRQEDTERHTGKATWRWRQRVEWCVCKSRNAKNHWQPLEANREMHRTNSLIEPLEGTNHIYTFISDFRPSELWDNKFLLFQATQFVITCYGNHWKII